MNERPSVNPAPKAPSPMMRHFLEVKAEYPDCLVFYRCGDFYETFYEDARVASRELDIVLTSRDKSSEEPVPLAGVPYHALDGYLARLIEKGYKVAIVEQMEDPKLAKGMVKRDVLRVVTPGLVLSGENLDASENNYLAAIAPTGENAYGLATLDLSTGDFFVSLPKSPEALRGELARLLPREVLLPESLRHDTLIPGLLPYDRRPLLAWRPEFDFSAERAAGLLMQQFETSTLSGFGLTAQSPETCAAGALLAYVLETQKQQAPHITRLRSISLNEFMVLDETTKVNLELERSLAGGKKRGSLLGVLDNCATPLGARTLRSWLNYPLMNVEAIRARQIRVEALYLAADLRRELIARLKPVGDLARLSARISMNHSGARDLAALRDALGALADLRGFLQEQAGELFAGFALNIAPLPALHAELAAAIAPDPPLSLREGHLFNKGYNAELDTYIDLAEHGKDQILRIEGQERVRAGIPSLKIRYNRVFGYYIELSKQNAEKAPSDYIRKQTLANAERFVTPELKDFEEKVLHAEERRNDLEYRLFELLRAKAAREMAALLRSAEAVGTLDVLACFAESAVARDYVRPEVTDGQRLSIVEGRHPVIELLQKSEPFIPNDILLDTGENELLIITGPNMAGKSTIMRQVALITLMAQMGSFVPAKAAEIGVVDRIFTRVGASDNLARGLSTFMVEMTETANILNNATKSSLIVLDEIGRGTSTFDGLSIAWAVAEHIHDAIGAKTLFATHYHELTELVQTKPGVRNLSIAVKEWGEQIIFLRKLVGGATNRSYGIQVGRLAGLPKSVIARAKEVLANLESGERDESGMPTFARFRKGRPNPNQLSLFAALGPKSKNNSPTLSRLDVLSPDALSPIEALNALFELKALREKERKL